MIGKLSMIVCAGALLGAACLHGSRGGGGVPDLAGAWSAELTVDETLPRLAALRGTTVGGLLTVPAPPIPSRSLPTEAVPGPTLDLARIGLPAAAAHGPVDVSVSRDSEVVLHFGAALVLQGRIQGDSVVGRWSHDFRSGGTGGTFVLRRAATPSWMRTRSPTSSR